MKRWLALIGVVALVALSGCGKMPPKIVAATGVVTLDGKPLPHATVEFVPELKDFGAEYNSTAVTDEQGRFELTCAFRNQPGAAVATHRVLVTDVTPEGGRGLDAASQARAAEHYRKLARLNRPIPDEYGNFTKTPLRVAIEPGKSSYEVALVRPARR